MWWTSVTFPFSFSEENKLDNAEQQRGGQQDIRECGGETDVEFLEPGLIDVHGPGFGVAVRSSASHHVDLVEGLEGRDKGENQDKSRGVGKHRHGHMPE